MKQGEFYEHPLRREWGVGEVLEITGNKISLNFEHAGRKTLDISIVSLKKVDRTAAVPFKIDIPRLEELCSRFHADQEHNRRGSDDGKMGIRVLADVKRRGLPTETTKRQLLAWCYTDGHPFQSGVSLAREICVAVYGRVLPDPDKS